MRPSPLLRALAAVAVIALVVGWIVVSTIDLPPAAQKALTATAAGLTIALVAAPYVGRALILRDPRSVWGPRLILIGVVVDAVSRSPAAAALPPPVRAMLRSLPDPESTPRTPREERPDA